MIEKQTGCQNFEKKNEARIRNNIFAHVQVYFLDKKRSEYTLLKILGKVTNNNK